MPIKPPTAKLTDANNAEPLALSSHRDSAPHTLELELRPLNPLPLLILPHQLSTMSALFWHPLINLHHQSLTPCIARYWTYRTSAHWGPQSWTKRRIGWISDSVEVLLDTAPAKSKKHKRKGARIAQQSATKPVHFFLLVLDIFHSSQLFPGVTDDSRKNEGMHRDVLVMSM